MSRWKVSPRALLGFVLIGAVVGILIPALDLRQSRGTVYLAAGAATFISVFVVVFLRESKKVRQNLPDQQRPS